jgi:hypothetical protein
VKIRTRILAGVASAALVGGLAALASPAYAVPHTYNVGASTVTCNTVTGTLKFATPLKFTGPTTGASSTTVKAKVGGCTSDDVGSPSNAPTGDATFAGTSSGILSGTGGSNCGSLLGASTSTGTLATKWTPPKVSPDGVLPPAATKFAPTNTVGGHLGAWTQSTLSQEAGGTFTVDASQAPYAGTYGSFTVGKAYNGVPGQITDTDANDDFRGGDNGHNSWINAITNLDIGALAVACFSTAGIKSITIGIAGISAG